MKKLDLKKIYPHVIAIAVFLIVSIIFCKPAIQGKVMQQHDMVAVEGMVKSNSDHQEKYGTYPLWNTNMFSGMPNFQIRYSWSHPLANFNSILSLGLPEPANYFFLAALAFYILALCFGFNPYVSMFSALAYAFSTYNPVIINAGHLTKMVALAYAPGIFAGLKLLFDKKYWLGLAVGAFFMTLHLTANHPQITYYLLFIGISMGVVYLIKWIKEKEWMHMFKVIGLSIVIALIGLGNSAPTLMNSYEYAKYTMRGGKNIETKDGEVKATKTKGLDYDYASMWSISKSEIITLFMPKSFGGSSSETIPTDSRFVEYLTQKEVPQQNAEQLASQLPGYWGGLESTSGPNYLGVVVFLLALLGVILVKGNDRWWILASFIIGAILAFGKYMPSLNEFLFNTLPMYNKFRAPSMALVIPQLVTPLMAGLFLNSLTKQEISFDKAQVKKGLYILGGLTGILLLMYLFNDYSSSALDAQIKQAFGEQRIGAESLSNIVINGLMEERKAMFLDAIFRFALFAAVIVAVLYLYIKKIISPLVLVVLSIIVNTGDLLAIGKTYLNESNYVEKDELITGNYTPTTADAYILSDTDPHFRVFHLSGDRFSEARTSYFHRSIGGYHPAKLRNYQDIIETKLSAQPNMAVLNMLDTRYFIYPAQQQNAQPQVQRNSGALGAAWFVDSLVNVKNAVEELKYLDKFNPANVVVAEEAQQLKQQFFVKDTANSIKLTKYRNDTAEYKTNAKTEQYAVFSEVFYPAGWNAYIDNKKVAYNKVDYLLRGLAIPAGQHEIKFVFEPETYKISASIAWWSGWAMYATIFIAFIAMYFEQKRKGEQAA